MPEEPVNLCFQYSEAEFLFNPRRLSRARDVGKSESENSFPFEFTFGRRPATVTFQCMAAWGVAWTKQDVF